MSSASKAVRLLVPLMLGLALGCVHAPAPEARAGRTETRIQVENLQFDGVVVHVMHGTAAVRLGDVDGFQTRIFVLPPGISSTSRLALRATRRSSDLSQLSPTFDLLAGRSVVWVLRASPGLSSLMIR